MLSTDQSFEMFPRHNGHATIVQILLNLKQKILKYFALNLIISVPLTNK